MHDIEVTVNSALSSGVKTRLDTSTLVDVWGTLGIMDLYPRTVSHPRGEIQYGVETDGEDVTAFVLPTGVILILPAPSRGWYSSEHRTNR